MVGCSASVITPPCQGSNIPCCITQYTSLMYPVQQLESAHLRQVSRCSLLGIQCLDTRHQQPNKKLYWLYHSSHCCKMQWCLKKLVLRFNFHPKVLEYRTQSKSLSHLHTLPNGQPYLYPHQLVSPPILLAHWNSITNGCPVCAAAINREQCFRASHVYISTPGRSAYNAPKLPAARNQCVGFIRVRLSNNLHSISSSHGR